MSGQPGLSPEKIKHVDGFICYGFILIHSSNLRELETVINLLAYNVFYTVPVNSLDTDFPFLLQLMILSII